ncbi:MAG: peptidoglycan DD-metalloendopeptidase family protein [Bacillota bacterium]
MQAGQDHKAQGKQGACDVFGRLKNYIRAKSKALALPGKALLILCFCVLLFSIGIYLGFRASFTGYSNGQAQPIETSGQNGKTQDDLPSLATGETPGSQTLPEDRNNHSSDSKGGPETVSENSPNEEARDSTAPLTADDVSPEPGETADSAQEEEAALILAFSRIIKPVSGEIIRCPGWFFSEKFEEWRFYPGVDIAATAGAEVKAVASGVIKGIYTDETLGEMIVIGHGSRYQTCYGRVSWSGLVPGQEVSQGETIAFATGDAVHFQLLENSEVLDPVPRLQEGN